MLTNKHSVNRLVALCAAHGINKAVISPGSRNAPLTIAFNQHPDIDCYSISDERSAGFIALGMAQSLEQTVVLICTSGSAALNYSPAISEAFYQGIPVLVITADRPIEMIDQMEGQSIRQYNIFSNYIKSSYQFLQEAEEEIDLSYNERISNEAIINTTISKPGPVHINIPLREPLYNIEENSFPKTKPIFTYQPENYCLSLPERHIEIWKNSTKKMILVGQLTNNPKLESVLNEISKHEDVIILTERTSNVHGENFIPCVDRVLATMISNKEFQPDMLITIGQDIVSKRIKAFLRDAKPANHWHIANHSKITDTYFSLTEHIILSPTSFLNELVSLKQDNSDYRTIWKSSYTGSILKHEKYLSCAPYSDLLVWDKIINKVPDNTELHLANSTAIRYAQLFENRKDILYRCNRGTSGIDGSGSTALGASLVNNKNTLLISGDISFLYDSNVFWNSYLHPGFKVIVINNNGGGIFKFIDGPTKSKETIEFFTTPHNTNIEKLAEAYGVLYKNATELDSIEEKLDAFFAIKEGAAIFEIQTPEDINAKVLKDYFKSMK
jgi:2-succinyl-5-enolpyruvyl-6-hydroxy-3-cyclohexene-1-carboxylate synthase